MIRLRPVAALLAPLAVGATLLVGTALTGCGGNKIEDTLKVAGLLFLTGLIGRRGSTATDAAPLGRAQIAIENGRGKATLYLAPPVGTAFPTADVKVAGTVKDDGTLDLSGELADGTPVRIAGRSGTSIYLTIGTKTTEHTSPIE